MVLMAKDWRSDEEREQDARDEPKLLLEAWLIALGMAICTVFVLSALW